MSRLDVHQLVGVSMATQLQKRLPFSATLGRSVTSTLLL